MRADRAACLQWIARRGDALSRGAKRRVCMPEWVIYTVVGLIVGLNLGYVMGIHRGSAIVGELIGGIVDGVSKAVGGSGK